MGYYLVPYSNCYPQFVLCVKGYSKIEIKTKGTNAGMRIDIYTANDLSSNSKKSTETLLGTVLSTTGEEVDISDNDYIWFYCHDASNGVNKEGFYIQELF